MKNCKTAAENQSISILRQLLSYIIPGIAGLIFNSLYIVVDGIFVARMLGREPLAAVTVGVPVVEVLLSLSMLVSVGAGVLISVKNGRREHKKARDIFNISVRLLAIASVLIAAISLIFINPLARMLGATSDIMALVVEYLSYFFAFSPAFMFSYAMCTWLRNDSQPRLAMTAQIIGALSNVFLDWYFMGPLKMGIGGAAIATGLGPLISIIIMLPHFMLKKGNLYLENVKMDLKIIYEILLRGIPSFIMEFALGITTLCVNIAIGIHIGALGFAAFGIVGYIALIVLSVFLGMAEGSQPLISFYHGANEKNNIRTILKISLCISSAIGIIAYLLLFKYPEIPVNVFADNDIELVEAAATATIYYFPALFVSGMNILLASYMQSIGHWKESVVISLCRCLLLLLPLLMVLPMFLGNNGIWISVPLAEILTLPVAYVLLSRRHSCVKGI
ncbi:MATE family efflux transporter [Sedimentibacter hydroxybenzoicus DSM 7310]|uniref:Multidrug export protein MepA n=1 Tax=Sedimentibacter hydroxybenzoicus DSM 7310 TaxID=1123245 RepID=A0A974BIB1_SEDHY|nr:MATE family efflux transporter [Sedimentibacter hydroxybenzoicus]NYB73322.1 MATE family efflux transporter [Sedimentibacter hydroxybenzoicus DSM 7310]